MDLFDDFREVSLLPFILPKQNGYSVLWNVDLNGFEIKLPNGELFYSPNFFNKKISDRCVEYFLENDRYDIYTTNWKELDLQEFFKINFENILWKQDFINLYGKKPLPRLTSWYGDEGKSYSYSGIKSEPNTWNTGLLYLKREIEKVAEVEFNSVLLNWYRNGEDYMNWHADDEKELGVCVVDIGGGTADIAVISLGGTVVNTSIKIAGDDFDEAIVRYMRKKHNLLIGERTAEDIKIKIGTTYPLVEEEKMEVRGRNLVTGLPKTVTVTSSETEEALRESTGQIVEAVIGVLEQTPPELSADILDRGIVLTGGGSLLRGLEELIEERTGINTMTAEDPMKVVAIGTGQFVEFMSGRKEF